MRTIVPDAVSMVRSALSGYPASTFAAVAVSFCFSAAVNAGAVAGSPACSQ
ncbi:hypothetical protein ACIHFC_37405 [Streptomyces sp. NPDC052013]|uniref:hypothetical protein n=1 Tax=Streptomyces sp. NPDC052013 TaxID=3365679 RepID=UPI0037D12716